MLKCSTHKTIHIISKAKHYLEDGGKGMKIVLKKKSSNETDA